MAIEQAGVQLVAAGGDVYITTINNATKATNAFVDSADQGSGKVNAAGQVMIGALRQIGTIAVDALAQAAKATAAFVGDSINLAGDFESGMLNFQAVAGKDVDTKGLDQFRDLFLQLGKELPVSTSEVQQAAIEMVKGGIDPAIVAAGGLRQNIQFAAAAMGGDLVAAANVSAKILGGWADANATAQQKADFLTHSTDLLTKAANASSVDVHELSLGIFNAQGIAKTAGVSFDDLTTTLAALSPRFASSSEAGNSLKNVIARLQPTTDNAAAAMQGLGLITADGTNKFYDAQGSFIGFEQASQLLQDSLKGLTDQQKQAVLQTIFGNDAMNAAAGLADLGAAGYQRMADSLSTANGVAENAALKQQGFNTALENAKGSVEALQITIGSALLPVMTDLLNNVLAPGVNILTDLATSGNVSDKTFSNLSPTMQDVATIAQEVFNDIKVGIGVLSDIGSEIQNLIGWFGKAGDAGDDLGGAITDLSGIWNKALTVIQDVGGGYMAIAQSILPIVSRFWRDHGTEITEFLQTAYDKIIRIVNLALDLYDAIVPKVLGSVAEWINKHATGIQAVLSGAWQAISGIIDGALTLIEGAIKIALDLINGNWQKAWEDLKSMSAAFVLDLQKVIGGFLEIIAGFFNTNLQEIADLWSHNWDMLVEIASKVADRMVEVGANIIQGVIDGIERSAGALFDAMKEIALGALHAATDALGISSPSTEFQAVGGFITEGLIAGVNAGWPALTELIGSLSSDLVDDMEGIGKQLQDAVADGFGATASIDRQIAANLDKFKDVLPQYEQYTTGALKEAQQQAEGFLDPAEGAKFFKMRSSQILEYAKLQKDLDEAQNAEDQTRIKAQMDLINKAQTAEIAQFDATKSAVSPMTEIANQINAVMTALAGMNLTDDQIKIVDLLSGAYASLVTPGPTRQQAYANPPMMQYPTTSSTTSSTNTTNVSMPIYTNNSPAALQQSWAIMQASMP